MSNSQSPRLAIDAVGPDYSTDEWQRYADVLRAGEYDGAFLHARLREASRYAEAADESLAWIPVHAWRALSQLGDVTVISPVLALADQGDLYAYYDFAQLSANLGEPAIAALQQILDDPGASEKRRSLAATGLGAIGASVPSGRQKVVQALMEHLRGRPDDGWVNGHIAEALMGMNERSVAKELLQFYHDGRIQLGLVVGQAIEQFAAARDGS